MKFTNDCACDAKIRAMPTSSDAHGWICHKWNLHSMDIDGVYHVHERLPRYGRPNTVSRALYHGSEGPLESLQKLSVPTMDRYCLLKHAEPVGYRRWSNTSYYHYPLRGLYILCSPSLHCCALPSTSPLDLKSTPSSRIAFQTFHISHNVDFVRLQLVRTPTQC